MQGKMASPRSSYTRSRLRAEQANRSENELVAERANREVQPRQARALALDHGLKARLDMVEQHRKLAAPLELAHLATERLGRVVAAGARERPQVVGEADFHQEGLEILGPVEHLPEALGRPRVSAVREVAVAAPDGERAALDRVAHGDGSHLVARDRGRLLRLELEVADRRTPSVRDAREVRPQQVVEEMLLEDRDRALRGGDDERLGVVLAPVVGDRGEVAHVIEVRVAHEHRLERVLRLELHAAGERTGVDGDAIVDDERARSMLRRLSAVATDDAKLHAGT